MEGIATWRCHPTPWRLVIRLAVLRDPPLHPRCPHCRGRAIGWGRTRGIPRRRCTSCGRTFTARTGTPRARLRHLRPFSAMPVCLALGLSARRAGRLLGVHPTTTWRWRHRLLAELHRRAYPRFARGLVEVTHGLVLCSRKGIRQGPRPRRRPEDAAHRARRRVEEGWRVLLACGPGEEVRYALWGRDRDRGPLPAAIRTMVRRGVPVVAERLAHLAADGTGGPARRTRNPSWLRHRLPPEPPRLRVCLLVPLLYRWLARFRGVGARYLQHYLAWFALFARPASPAYPPAAT